MKSFYTEGRDADLVRPTATPPYLTTHIHEGGAPRTATHEYSCARIAIYDAPAAAPRVEEVNCVSVGEYIESLSTRIYELARARGGTVPYTVVRELAENLIHADFAEPVVSILDGGNTIRFADQGPGIADKDRAVLPGFTTAQGTMKRYIRGVGSGLPIVSDFLSVSGGRLLIEDNLGTGAVVTITTSEPPTESVIDHGGHTAEANASSPSIAARARESDPPHSEISLSFELDESLPVAPLRLSTRQKQVLALVLESGSAGPSIVSRELGVGLSTAYRDLASLEEIGLISSVGGKRTLTEKGMSLLDDVISSS